MELEEWIPQRMLASFFHVDKGTVRKWQQELAFPKPFYVGSIAFYKARDLLAWQLITEKNAPREPPKRPDGAAKRKKSQRKTAIDGETEEDA